MKTFYELRNIIRWNNVGTIKKETVLEHTAAVTYHVLIIHENNREKYGDFDLLKSMKMAMIHDLPELHVSDVPYPCKRDVSGLNKLLNKAEIRYMKKEYPEYLKIFKEFLSLKTKESLIVHLADLQSRIDYITSEMALGSSNLDFSHSETNKKIQEISEKLTQGSVR